MSNTIQGLALITNESIHMGQLKQSNDFGQVAGSASTLAGVFHTMPDISVGVSLFGLVSASTTTGGSSARRRSSTSGAGARSGGRAP